MNRRELHRQRIELFRSVTATERNPITGATTKRTKKVPVKATAVLEVDIMGLIHTLAGRALHSQRQQSALARGLVRVRITDVTE